MIQCWQMNTNYLMRYKNVKIQCEMNWVCDISFQSFVCEKAIICINPFTANVFSWNFRPLEIVSR